VTAYRPVTLYMYITPVVPQRVISIHVHVGLCTELVRNTAFHGSKRLKSAVLVIVTEIRTKRVLSRIRMVRCLSYRPSFDFVVLYKQFWRGFRETTDLQHLYILMCVQRPGQVQGGSATRPAVQQFPSPSHTGSHRSPQSGRPGAGSGQPLTVGDRPRR